MRKRPTQSMSDELRKAIREADNVYALAKATGLAKASIIRFRDGRRSLRLDKADILAAHFGFRVVREGK